MNYENAMLELPTHAPPDQAARRCGVRDGILLGFVLCTLAQTSEAGDQASNHDLRATPPPAVLRANTDFFKIPALADIHVYSATDFQPRKHTVFDSDPLVSSFNDAPMLRGTTVWQRMSDYKSHDGVRLLTLWHAQTGSVSLQAGKRGDPSLQWMSRLTKRGEAAPGLFDQLFSVSLARASNSLHNSVRASAVPLPSTQLPAATVSVLK
jgi:hypothetical protein